MISDDWAVIVGRRYHMCCNSKWKFLTVSPGNLANNQNAKYLDVKA